ncbi:hypothetical protein [Haloarcula pellucida]|nr:hypothetical protein [Halomicroarcula pellucida]MBX0347996.1 hypothetical protein [Halomicroarcula pellucida]
MADDKPASILTKSQRNYIQGKSEPSNPREYDRRIRGRIEYGFHDLMLLFEYLEQDELRKVFGSNYARQIEPHEEVQEETHEYATAGYVPHALAFIMRGLNYDDEPLYPKVEETGEEQPAFEEFIDAVEYGVRQYLEGKKRYSANVDVSIELTDVSLNEKFFEDETTENE